MMKTRAVAVWVAAILSMTVTVERTAVHAQAPASSSSQNAAPSAQQETYQDWTVACTTKDGVLGCTMSQQQRHSTSRQLVLAVELVPAKEGGMAGHIVLPFGLRLRDGVTVQVDDKPATPPVPFSTCLPVGCVVPIAFDAGASARLRAGEVLKLAAAANDDGKTVSFSVSLKGFSAARDRLKALGGG